MNAVQDIPGMVFKNGSALLLARVMRPNGTSLVPTDFVAADYSIGTLDENDPNAFSAVPGHVNQSLPINELLFATLQTGGEWEVDALGYNFKHVVDVTSHPAFPVAGLYYRVEFRLHAAQGPPIMVRFKLRAI